MYEPDPQNLTGRELASFAFLTSRHILVAFVHSFFLDDPQPTPSLLVIDFISHTTGSDPTDIKDVLFTCGFEFPEIMEGGAVHALSIRSDPAPTWHPDPTLKVPFHTAREDRLFVNTLRVAEGPNITTLLLFIPSSTVLSHLSSLPPPSLPSEKGRRFEWEEWGPLGTRMLVAPRRHSAVWVCYAFGMSYAAPYEDVSDVFQTPRGPKMVQIFDFGQVGIRRAVAKGEVEVIGDSDEGSTQSTSGGLQTRIHATESELPLRGVFTRPIRTSLPFMWRTRRVPFNPAHTFDAVILGEDAIITVSTVRLSTFCVIRHHWPRSACAFCYTCFAASLPLFE